MTSYSNINVQNAKQLFKNENSLVIDIRDLKSYQEGKLPGAIRFDERTIMRMRKTEQRHYPILIYCYHGNSSKEIASLLCALGFTTVYNLEGGYAAWCAELVMSDTASTDVAISPGLDTWLATQGFDSKNLNAINHLGFSPLMQASRLGLCEKVKQLLNSGADVNQTNNDGNNALWLACFSDNVATVKELLSHKIDVDNRNSTGATALIYASSAGKAEIVDQLLNAGANPFIRTQDDYTALDLAATPKVYHLLKRTQDTAFA